MLQWTARTQASVPDSREPENPQSLQFQLTAARVRVLSSLRAVGQGVRAPYPAAGTMQTVPFRRWHLPLKRPEIRAQQLEPWVSVGVPAGFASSAAPARWTRGHFSSLLLGGASVPGNNRHTHLCSDLLLLNKLLIKPTSL